MSKMREAYSKYWADNLAHTTRRDDFYAGYAAAIAAVKEGGPFLIVAYDDESGICEIRDVANPHNKDLNFIDLYRLPGDEKLATTKHTPNGSFTQQVGQTLMVRSRMRCRG